MKLLLTVGFAVYIIVYLACAFYADAADEITDARIAGIALATDEVQIEGSTYAVPRIAYFDLKNFANAMVVDYQNYRNIMLDWCKRYDVIPEESDESRAVLKRGQEAIEELKRLVGRDFEKRYTDYQIELHVRTIDTIDKVFLPNVENRELRKLILQIRPVIQGRWDWIVRIRATYP